MEAALNGRSVHWSERPRWSLIANGIIAMWLLSSPPTLGYGSRAMVFSDLFSGALLLVLTLLSARRQWAAWASCAVGLWVMSAPLVFYAPTASGYNNGSLLGMLIVVFSVVIPHLDLHDPLTRPPGWSYNPSGWVQRLPIVFLALTGFFSSRYMAAFQLEHIGSVWDPFFGDGTARVLKSRISEAFPVSDAGLGALSYLFDAVAGLIGGRRRWRTMPWMVILFGLFIIPPGVTSVVLIMLQPIGVGAWCTLCLATAVVMLMMVPPALDEVIASAQFLRRTRREGGSFWHAFWRGEGSAAEDAADRESLRSPVRESIHAVEIFSMPFTLLMSALVGIWLMAAPAILGMEGMAANNDYIAGALVATFAVVATAEPARATRFLNLPIGLWLLLAPWILGGGTNVSIWSDLLAGAVLIGLSIPKGKIEDSYGSWDRWVF